MELKTISPNVRELTANDGTRLLYSYSNLAAAHIVGRGFIRSSTFHSKATARHVRDWIPSGMSAGVVPQDELNELARRI